MVQGNGRGMRVRVLGVGSERDKRLGTGRKSLEHGAGERAASGRASECFGVNA